MGAHPILPPALARAGILEFLGEDEIEGLAALGEERHFVADEEIFREHEPADALFIVLAGEVKSTLRAKGQESELGVFREGDHFGRLALKGGQLCYATAIGRAAGRVFVLSSLGCAVVLSRLPKVTGSSPLGMPLKPWQRPSTADLVRIETPPPSPDGDAARIRTISSAVAGVAHEINTPLGVIENAASFMSEQLTPEVVATLTRDALTGELLQDVAEACRLIQKNVAHAARLVQSFKKLSVGQLAEPRDQVDLVRVINEVLNVFRAKTLSVLPPGPTFKGAQGQSGAHRLFLASSRLNIVVDCKLSDEERIWDGFPGLFSRVLLNLLTNIDRYAYPGDSGGKVEISVTNAKPARGVPYFGLTVRDFGAGIAPDNLPRIFDPFFTTGRDKGGTGLGLAMVHNLVTQGLNGTVRVQSTLGEGTTFELRFPKTAPDHGPLIVTP